MQNNNQPRLNEREKLLREKSRKAFVEALELIDEFNSSYSFEQEILTKAIRKLLEATDFYRANDQAFLYLAYIYQLIKDERLAFKYYEIAQTLNPRLPGLKDLQENFSLSGLLTQAISTITKVTDIKYQDYNKAAQKNMTTKNITGEENQEVISERVSKFQSVKRLT